MDDDDGALLRGRTLTTQLPTTSKWHFNSHCMALARAAEDSDLG